MLKFVDLCSISLTVGARWRPLLVLVTVVGNWSRRVGRVLVGVLYWFLLLCSLASFIGSCYCGRYLVAARWPGALWRPLLVLVTVVGNWSWRVGRVHVGVVF
jgi:hypothetical protein